MNTGKLSIFTPKLRPTVRQITTSKCIVFRNEQIDCIQVHKANKLEQAGLGCAEERAWNGWMGSKAIEELYRDFRGDCTLSGPSTCKSR